MFDFNKKIYLNSAGISLVHSLTIYSFSAGMHVHWSDVHLIIRSKRNQSQFHMNANFLEIFRKKLHPNLTILFILTDGCTGLKISLTCLYAYLNSWDSRLKRVVEYLEWWKSIFNFRILYMFEKKLYLILTVTYLSISAIFQVKKSNFWKKRIKFHSNYETLCKFFSSAFITRKFGGSYIKYVMLSQQTQKLIHGVRNKKKN